MTPQRQPNAHLATPLPVYHDARIEPPPKRVQLSRANGWRMPPNTVNVARPTLWGNPFYVSRWRTAADCVALFTDLMRGVWDPQTCSHLPDAWTGYKEHQDYVKRMRERRGCFPSEAVNELRGKNLKT